MKMNWTNLLCEKRQGTGLFKKQNEKSEARNEFQKDYHRIVCSASFRRLQDKTQVFPLDNSDFIRTRLTHSLEVSSFAKSLGQTTCQYLIENGKEPEITPEIKEKICNILECAGLIHDIGNPPFGHFGEEVIRHWFKVNLSSIMVDDICATDLLSEQMLNDLYNFEGNAQALRLLSKLHFLVDENGMRLTYALLNTLIKYPVSSCEIDKGSGNIRTKKMGYYFAEEDLFDEICNATGAIGCRYPLTYLLEAADDIAYKTADIEDAVKKGCLSYQTLLKELKGKKYIEMCLDNDELARYNNVIGWLEEKYERALDKNIVNPELNAIQNWIISVQGFLMRCATFAYTKNYKEIMNGDFNYELLNQSYGNALVKALGGIAFQYVFQWKPILKLEISAGTILEFLLDKFINAAVNYDHADKLSSMDNRLMSMVSENYKQTYHIYSMGKAESEKLYLRLFLVTDFICGMTDTYAKRLYQELMGI